MRHTAFRSIALLSLAFLIHVKPTQAEGLEQLRYNNPALVVDLGVGLWAWPIPCDTDEDGDYDLIVSCPDKPSNGVWMFENTSGDTSKDKMPVFKPGKLLSKTVHYVMPSYIDGGLRVLSPGFEYPDFAKQGINTKTKLPIEANFHKPVGTQTKGPKVRHNQWRYVDYDGDEKRDLIVGIEDWSDYGWDDAWDMQGNWKNGPLHGWVYWFRNRGSSEHPQYEPPQFLQADGKRLEVYGCPSPNFEDFDGDGDLDLICGSFLDHFTYFENIGTRKAPVYESGRTIENDMNERLTMELEMIVPVAFDWDKDGDFDLIVGDEDGRVAFVENLGKKQSGKSTTPFFSSPRYFQQEADTLKCGALATPVAYDWDGDGDQDILSGNTAGFIEFFENLSGPRISNPSWNKPARLRANDGLIRFMAGANGSIQGPAEAKWGYTTLNVADWDSDGLPDLVINSILGKVVWFKNIGTRTSPKLAAEQPIEVEWKSEQPNLHWGWLRPSGKELLTQWRTTPVVYDFNNDGLLDLAMLDTEGYLAYFERAKVDERIVLKSPIRAFLDEQGQPLRLNRGDSGRSGRRKIAVTDWDGDGKFDLLLNSSNADLLQQISSNGSSWTFKFNGSLANKNIEGHDVSPTTIDLDGDRVPDFIGGAEDGRFYFLQNPRSSIVCSDFLYDSAPFPSCHASSIVETADRSIVTAWFGGTHEKHPDVGIWLSRYVQGKWTTPIEVANGLKHSDPDAKVDRYPTWNPVLFQPKTKTGTAPLLLFYKVGPSPQTWWGMAMTSDDNGKTWSEPNRLPNTILGAIKNKPVQLPNGEIIAGSSTESDEAKSKWQVHIERSSDLGKTWTKIGPLNDGITIQAIQPSILVLGDQKLLAIGRSRQDRIFETQSNDGGKSWGPVQLGNLPNNNSGIDAVTLSDGRHLIIYNHVSGTPGQWGGKRTPLNIAISNNGYDWKPLLVLEDSPGEYSYPAIIQTSDGMVHVTYTWNRKKIKHMSIDPAKF